MPASVLTIAALPLILLPAGIQVPRDGVRESRSGTAVVSGVVLIDDRDPRPLRRARVVLGGDGIEGRTAITEDDGLPVYGRSKRRYQSPRYGQDS